MVRQRTTTLLFIVVGLHLFSAVLSSDVSTSPSSSCPIDFSYVSSFFPTSCRGSSSANNFSNACCLDAFNIFGLGVALYLRQTLIFELPNNATLFACYNAYQNSLSAEGLPNFSVFDCKELSNSTHFIRNPALCSGIETVEDWQRKVGITAMDSSCSGDLSDLAACQICTQDTLTAIAIATKLSANNSYCFYFGVLYATGFANKNGPTNRATATCLLAMQPSTSSRHSSRAVVVYSAIGAAIVVCLGSIAVVTTWLWCIQRRQLYHEKFVRLNKDLLNGKLQPNTGAIWYQFEDLKAATNNFGTTNVIGSGGYGVVYRGTMPDGSQVAVKSIKNCTKEGDAEFCNEVEVINNVRHRNLVVLRGCCVASNSSLGHLRLLIYDYMPNGSLEDYLFRSTKPVLRWADRERIALDTAMALAYLHRGVQPAIIHRDIKPSNILLDQSLNAHVADFGLARVTMEGMSHMTTRVAGTQGYLAPEYALYGQLTEKSDVYSFGVVLLVLISGRQAVDLRAEYPLITDWAWIMVKNGNTLGVVDERIRHSGPAHLMERMVCTGILCAHLLVAFRPTMYEALQMLQGSLEIPRIPDRPLPLTHETIHVSDCSSSLSSAHSGAEPHKCREELLRELSLGSPSPSPARNTASLSA
ncbi:hypothetical protein KP509_23G030300 [Ceratopteris richardii]|uniref:non-specific serine/threonine protein kinase n=1 Tax=Ceratopteris richardii TaxID=49495 RepID=A0A8T2S1B5_CERRI|nr:hypothetical protein KP509_23G030300 [Ceratopteris richardii]